MVVAAGYSSRPVPLLFKEKWRRKRDSTEAQRDDEPELRRPQGKQRKATHKKITLSATSRKQQRKNEKSQVQVYLQT
ncbi:MAG: hypothetical protein IJY46_08345 [Lentisphaeria bacterium]|nr:hypothetical protein [Lentisphaeria bacterium]